MFHGRQSWGIGVATPDFGLWGSQRNRGGRRRVMKYYYILLWKGSMFKIGDF